MGGGDGNGIIALRIREAAAVYRELRVAAGSESVIGHDSDPNTLNGYEADAFTVRLAAAEDISNATKGAIFSWFLPRTNRVAALEKLLTELQTVQPRLSRQVLPLWRRISSEPAALECTKDCFDLSVRVYIRLVPTKVGGVITEVNPTLELWQPPVHPSVPSTFGIVR